MSKVEDFLTTEEEREVVDTIREVEKSTSGEIRVHIEKHTDMNILARSAEVFHWLKMDNTIQRNGVLIYIAVEDQKFAIYGDKGIDSVVPNDFWESTKNVISGHFKEKNFKQGLIDGILMAGKQLQEYFPWHHKDTNELPDSISKKI